MEQKPDNILEYQKQRPTIPAERGTPEVGPNPNLLLSLGTLVLLISMAMPFAGVWCLPNDLLPFIIGFVGFVVGVFMISYAIPQRRR